MIFFFFNLPCFFNSSIAPACCGKRPWQTVQSSSLDWCAAWGKDTFPDFPPLRTICSAPLFSLATAAMATVNAPISRTSRIYFLFTVCVCLLSVYSTVRTITERRVSQGAADPASPLRVHWLKSMGLPHPLQLCARSNSSEKISFSWPHSGHLHVNDLRFLNCW